MNDVTLAIFAGGRGSRMGGTKDRLTIGGQPILLHLLEQVKHAGPTLLVAAPRQPLPIGAESFDRVILDEQEHAGPLAALRRLFQAVETPLVVTLSVDMPNVTQPQVRWLAQMIEPKSETAGMLCRRSDEAEPWIEPFPAIYRRTAGRLVAEHLAAGHTSLRSLLRNESFIAAETPASWPASVWLNLNHREDLRQINAKFL